MPNNRYFYDNKVVLSETPPVNGAWVYDPLFEGYILGSKLAKKWDDLRFPATAVNPPGAVTDPTFDVSKVGWLFPHNATAELAIVAQLPHSWVNGTELRPHVHWEKTTSAVGNVYWEIEYQWSKPNFSRASAVIVGSYIPVFTIDTLDTQNVTALPAISGTGYKDSDSLIIKLRRVHNKIINSVDVDNYGAAARLLEFDIHYLVDDFGSTEEFPF